MKRPRQDINSMPNRSFANRIKLSLKAITLSSAALLISSPAVQANIGAAHSSLVSEFASFNTPGIVDGRVEAIAIDGDTVFVGGTFTQIHDPLSDEIINQSYLFAYSKSSGNIIRDFDPILNLQVRALETTGDGTGVFVGGVFSLVNGKNIGRGLAKLDMNGDRVSGFNARPNALVKNLVRHDNTLYVGGNFSSISGTPIEHLAAIDTTTGAVSPNLNLDFDGVISTTRTTGVQGVDDFDVTSDGKLLVAFGNFSIIDGMSRPRLALIELEGQARVSNWNTDLYDPQCHQLWPVQIRGIDIAPDDSYFVTGSSGARQNLNPACDTLIRFDIDDLTNTDVQPTWVNYTGGDSIFEVVTTEHAIYAGGHFRWLDNFNSTNARSGGPGSTDRLGFAAFDPLNGLTLREWRSDRNPRGVGVFTIISEPEGLYIGDDTDFMNGTEHKKLKFLPISTDAIARPEAPTLPTSLISPEGNALNSHSFDGNVVGASVELQSTGWSDTRGGMLVGGQLFHSDNNGTLWMSELNEGVFSTRIPVDLFGLSEDQWALSQLGGMFFDYELSRVYYTEQGNSQLLYRAFTPDGTFFGDVEVVAEHQGDILWADVSGMDVVDGHIYFALNDGTLNRAEIDGTAVIAGTTEVIGGPAIDGRNWNNNLLAFLGEGEVIGGGNSNQIEIESSGDSQGTGRFRKFEFPVPAGTTVPVRLEWLDPDAELRIFIRDASNNLVVSDTTSAGSPKFLTIPAGAGGTYVASILVADGSTSYALVINPDEAAPEPLADFEFNSSGAADNNSWQVFNFEVQAGDLVEAMLIWDDPNARVNMFLRNENNNSVDRDTSGSSPAMTSAIATTSGVWSVGVKIKTGDVNFSVLVDTTGEQTEEPPVEPPVVTNLALDGVASQSSTAFNGPANLAIDGNTDGIYRNDSVTHTTNSAQPWWEVQLSELSTIENIVLYNRTDACCTSRLTNYTVSVLDNNGNTTFTSNFTDAPNPSNTINVGGVMGSVVRVQLMGTNPLSLAEVQVMGYTQQ